MYETGKLRNSKEQGTDTGIGGGGGGGVGVNVHFCPLHIQNLKVDKIKSGQKWTKVDKIQIENYTTLHFHVKH